MTLDNNYIVSFIYLHNVRHMEAVSTVRAFKPSGAIVLLVCLNLLQFMINMLPVCDKTGWTKLDTVYKKCLY